MYIYTYIYVFMYTYIYLYVSKYVYKYIYIYTNIDIYTYVHVYFIINPTIVIDYYSCYCNIFHYHQYRDCVKTILFYTVVINFYDAITNIIVCVYCIYMYEYIHMNKKKICRHRYIYIYM
jgi:hypothetical protein